MEVPTFTIGSWPRLLVGFLCATTAGLLLQLSRTLDWGMAAICWVPAAVLLLLALQLVRRTRLRAEVDGFTLETGWLFRRGWTFKLAGGEVEFVPTAGLWAVVLHRNRNRITLATWVTRPRALALANWLDAVAGTPLPRTEAARPENDR